MSHLLWPEILTNVCNCTFDNVEMFEESLFERFGQVAKERFNLMLVDRRVQILIFRSVNEDNKPLYFNIYKIKGGERDVDLEKKYNLIFWKNANNEVLNIKNSTFEKFKEYKSFVDNFIENKKFNYDMLNKYIKNCLSFPVTIYFTETNQRYVYHPSLEIDSIFTKEFWVIDTYIEYYGIIRPILLNYGESLLSISKCSNCGRYFMPKSKKAKYCSEKCRKYDFYIKKTKDR